MIMATNMTVKALRLQAKEYGVKSYWKMKKAELLVALARKNEIPVYYSGFNNLSKSNVKQLKLVAKSISTPKYYRMKREELIKSIILYDDLNISEDNAIPVVQETWSDTVSKVIDQVTRGLLPAPCPEVYEAP